MNKRAIFILCLVILFCVFFYLGFTMKREEKDIIENTIAIKNDTNEMEENGTIETSISEEKTTPNTILVLKKLYLDCGHTIEGKATIPEEIVNLTENEVKEKYPNWKLEEFSKEKIVLFKELESFCGEHYLLIEDEGYISIYTIDEEENKTLKEKTRLYVEYLPETDRITLRNGIMIYGTENLNKILEDFES